MPPKKNPAVSKAAGCGDATALSSKSKAQSEKNKFSKPTTNKNTQQKKTASIKTATGKNPAKKDSKATPSKSEKKTLTQEQLAAIKIQSHMRCFLAKKTLLKLKKEKHEYDEMIEQIQKTAWLDIIERQRKEDEEKRLKEDVERKRKEEDLKWRKDLLNAAFDGELDEITKIIAQAEVCIRKISKLTENALENFVQRYKMGLIECKDANNNSALSEASAGGDEDTVTFFMQNGAAINSLGQHRRTPIYRAAFAGHYNIVKLLLECGGDPRILDSDGMQAAQIAALPEIKVLIEEWDIGRTDVLFQMLEEENEKRNAEESRVQKEEQQRIQVTVDNLEKAFANKQKMLLRAYQELNKRIREHDKCVAVGYDKTDVTLKVIHAAEEDLLTAQLEERNCREELSRHRSELREQSVKEDEDPRCAKCHIKELDDVIMRDVGNKIKDSNKRPIIIDTSNQAVTFLRYRDTNYLNVLSPKDMEKESLRKALLGAIRYGKSLVLDMMEINLLEFIEERLNDIQEGLFHALVNGTILTNDNYLSLVQKEDGPEYSKESFTEHRVKKFSFILVTKIWPLPNDWLDRFYAIRVIIPAMN